jgi:hypothetical protein
MGEDLANSNVNRSYSIAATSLAIFTFLLGFMYPKWAAGEIDSVLFQATLIVMGIATFSIASAAIHYYALSLNERVPQADRPKWGRRADRFWLIGYALLFLAPSLILFTVGLDIVGAVWLGLWLVSVLYLSRNFPRVLQTRASQND